MTDNQYEEDKVYLRDKRTGQIYLSERYLEQNGNFEPHVPNPSKKKADKAPEPEKKADPTKVEPPADKPDATKENPDPAESKDNPETAPK